MNNQLTEIAYILDRSGSMIFLTEAAISGFNSFVAEQKDGPGSANLTLVLFDHEFLSPHQSTPLIEIPDLTTETYIPRGATALLDAVGTTINTLGKRLAALPEADRPGHVIIAIFTDGLENASHEFTLQQINSMITHQRQEYSWEFIFLAANQDAIATAAQMGIAEHSSVTIHSDHQGNSAANSALAKSVLKSREQNFFEGKVCECQKASMLSEYNQALSDHDL